MSLSTLRAAAAVAALLSAAAVSDARAQETFTSNDPLTTIAAAPEVAGTVMKLEAGGATVYEAVSRRHAAWLAGRGMFEAGRAGVVVYRDGVAVGGAEALRGIPMSEVAEVRRLDSIEAAHRFGLGHAAGAILVTTK